MADRVLVPLDGSEKAEEALEYAIEEFPEAEITVLHALDLTAGGPAKGTVILDDDAVRENIEGKAQSIFETAQEIASKAGYDGELETVQSKRTPADAILEQAEDFDTIVMGTHGRVGVGQKLLGSVAETVVRRSPVSVVVVK